MPIKDYSQRMNALIRRLRGEQPAPVVLQAVYSVTAVKRLVARLLCAESPVYMNWYSCGCGGSGTFYKNEADNDGYSEFYPCDKHMDAERQVEKCTVCKANHITLARRIKLLADINLGDPFLV